MADDFILSENEPPSEIEKTRFLVIKAWGYGFWSEGHHLASQLLLAELTHRTPVVLWGKNCLFRGNADLDASTHFFQEISTARLEDLPSTSRFFPGKWSWANLREENVNKWEGEGSRIAAQYLFARPEEVLVSDFFSNIETIRPWIGPSSKYFGKSDDEIYAVLFQKYLKPTSSIASRADTFFNQIKQSRPWIAVHVRGSDKVLESPRLQETNAACLNLLDQIIEQHPTLGVLLLTDSTPIVAEYQERYGERLRCTEATRSATDVGVHLSGHNGVELGEEVFVDTLLALKCDFFIGNRMSNVSLAIASLRDWPAGHIHLFGENSGRGENLLLHRRPAKDGPACRLCDAPTIAKFSRLLLSRYTVTYFACTKCDSLQTETPHWLDEAYSPTHEPVDAGAAGRTLLNVLSLCRLLEIIGIRKEDRCVDFYGGNGLFARLMRDAGYNFFSQDKFGNDAFCRGFAWSSLDRPVQLITIFESGEQFTYPSAKWDALFASNPNFILGTTGLYTYQGSDWALLSPESGRNTFFYSPTALAEIAASRGWEAYLLGDYFLLSRQPLSEKTLSDLEEWNQNLDCAIKESLHHWSNNSQEFVSEDNRHLRQLLRLRESGTRIAVDGFFFRFASGIARVWKSLLAEWSADGFGEFVVVLDRERSAPRFAGITYLDIPCHTYADRLADREMLQEICDRETISLFISTYYTTPTKTPAVLMVHDMIPEVLGFDLSSEQWREKHEAIRYCHHYLCVSNSTVSDLIRIFPHISQDRIRLAHCGTDFRTPSREGITNFLERYGINQPYFLISGTKTDYKNAHLFFKAFASLGAARSDYAIVCTNS
ncbi:MAG: hypothetical protein Q8O00_03540, partial [Holophaga sp.]|nr:hypothetical protein [Holophaga sp.]